MAYKFKATFGGKVLCAYCFMKIIPNKEPVVYNKVSEQEWHVWHLACCKDLYPTVENKDALYSYIENRAKPPLTVEGIFDAGGLFDLKNAVDKHSLIQDPASTIKDRHPLKPVPGSPAAREKLTEEELWGPGGLFDYKTDTNKKRPDIYSMSASDTNKE